MTEPRGIFCNPRNQGLALAVITFVNWGFSPIYLSAVKFASAWELWGIRALLFVPFMALYISYERQWPNVLALLKNRRMLAFTCLSALVLAVNNILFMYAVNIGRALECSLSNFILPLVNIFCGMVFFKESLNRPQKIAVALAVVGVTCLGLVTGEVPRIALVMSVLFAAYAAIRKGAGLAAVDSSFVEMVLVSPLALTVLLTLQAKGLLVFGSLSPKHDGLLLFSVVFFLPAYIMFNQAVKLVDLSLVGFLQYITPVLQFFIAILFLRETFTWSMGACYLIIWAALVFFSVGTFRRQRHGG